MKIRSVLQIISLPIIFLLLLSVIANADANSESGDSAGMCSTPEECEQLRQQMEQEQQDSSDGDADDSSSDEYYEDYEGTDSEDTEEDDEDYGDSNADFNEGSEEREDEQVRTEFCRQNPQACERMNQVNQEHQGRPFIIQDAPCASPQECERWCNENPTDCEQRKQYFKPGEYESYRQYGQEDAYPPRMYPPTIRPGDGMMPPCSSPQECTEWCETNKEACARMKEMMGKREMMREKAVGRMFASEPTEQARAIPETVVYEAYHEVAPEEMIMYKLFEGLERQMDPSQFKQYCPDAEKMVDAALSELKTRNLFDIQRACGGLQTEVDRCRAEAGRRCSSDMNCETMDKPRMISMCEEMLAKNPEMMQQNLHGRSCVEEIEEKYEMLKENCQKQEEHQERCEEGSSKACERMEEALQRCEGMSEDKLRNVMIEKGKRMCEMMGHESTAGLVGARDYVKDEYKVVLDEKAEETLDVEKKTDELEKAEEEKGVGYKLKWFFGQTKEIEEAEATQLEEQASKLDEAIQALTAVTADLDNEQAKTAISAQITFLEQRRDELRAMASKKLERAGGLGSMVKELFT